MVAYSRVVGRIAACALLGLAMPVRAQTTETAPTAHAENAARGSAAQPRAQQHGPALQRIVSLDLRDATLEAALDEIDRQAGIELQYTPRVVPVTRRVTVRLDRVTVAAALTELLRGTSVRVVVTAAGTVMLVRTERAAADTVPQVGLVGGWVRDTATGRPLKGAVVTIPGFAFQATTNDSGYYVIGSVPAGRRTVVARLLGYVPAERTVSVAGEQAVQVNFLLRMGQTRLQEVVVTATGPKRRLELGNDITILNADSIVATQPVSSVTELLATRVPGLEVLHTSGAPGDPARLRLRGAASISQSNDPVIIVDGVRVYYAQSDSRSANLANWGGSAFAAPSPLDQIDPNSIETIEVFKGPSAATMYGPDAANGVIVITTKKGNVGPPRWTTSIERGMTEMPGGYPDAYIRFGHYPPNPYIPSNLWTQCSFGVTRPCIADSVVRFQALNDRATTVLGNGNNMALNVGVSGGASALTYALTSSVDAEDGLLKLPEVMARQFTVVHGTTAPSWMQRPQTLNRWSVTSRLGAQLGAKADVSLSTLLTHERQQRSSLESQIGTAMGTYVDRTTGTYYPGQLMQSFYTRATDEATNFTNTVNLNWHPTAWLTGSADAGMNLVSRQDETIEPRGLDLLSADSVGSAGLGHGTALVKTVNLRLAATAPLRLGFRLETALGANYTGTTTSDLRSVGIDIPAGTSSLDQAGRLSTSESQIDVTNFGWYFEPTLNNRRLFLSTGLRLDGGNTYGTHVSLSGFPKIGISYLISDERWFPEALKPLVTTLRLRAAYGHAGVEPGVGAALRLYGQSQQWLDGQFVNVTPIQALGNSKLKPERSTEVEGGFDADLMGDRLSVGITWYRKMRYDALMTTPVAPSVYGDGVSIMRNVGIIRNTGLEFTLGAELVRTDLFTWRTDLNLSRNQNRVVAVNGGAPIALGNNQRVAAGYPLFGFWAKPIVGYADANGDGIIEAGEVMVGDSAVFMGSADPNYQLAIHTTVSLLHGTLSVDAGLQYQNGLTQLNQTLETNVQTSQGLNDPRAALGEQAAAVAAFWGMTNYGALQTVSTLRFNALSVAYRLPAAIAHLLGASAASLAVQGTNLGLWTSYRGKDPDVNANPTGNLVADTGILPVPRTWQLRLSVAY